MDCHQYLQIKFTVIVAHRALINWLAAAAGVVKSQPDSPLIMLIGDTSLLYDLNSLALLTHNVTPMVIVVTNNDGGAIFDFVAGSRAAKRSLYQMPHGFSF